MAQPIILIVDDDPQVLGAVGRDIKKAFGKTYKIMASESASEVLSSLPGLKNRGRDVALFLSDQRMPEMGGVEFLARAVKIYPEAKRALLTAYSDTQAAIQAINDVKLDYYFTKPWDPPEERLVPVLEDLLGDWQANTAPEYAGLRLIGFPFTAKSHEIKDFLSGNLQPYQWLDAGMSDKAGSLMALNGIEKKDLPAVFFDDGSFLLSPSPADIAGKIGLHPNASSDLYDLAIIGAGPAGLAAAVYGASEGLKTLVVEKRAPGGQAGTSSRIENYLGFPNGLSGSDLARRALAQAVRFGSELLSPQEVTRLETKGQFKTLHLASGQSVSAKALLVASGVNYRQLDKPGIGRFTGAGVYYGAATTEASNCKNQTVFVVGGGNSAGQAAMYLARFAQKVVVMVRGEGLAATMSSYLIDQLAGEPNIEVWGHAEVGEARGQDRLEEVEIVFNKTGKKENFKTSALFVFIGAKPYTEWLPDGLLKDSKGFVLTGESLQRDGRFAKMWPLDREPAALETSIPGVFAAGDVRSGAMNRVASAVGEGAMTVGMAHRYLADS